MDIALREEKEDEILRILRDSREGRLSIPTRASDLFSMMTNMRSPRGPAQNDKVPVNWRAELMYLLVNTQGVPFHRICTLVGISPTRVWIERRKDRELADIIKAFQAAYFEREAEDPTLDLAPALVTFALKARAGWRDQQTESLSPDRLRAIIDKVIVAIKDVIPDEALQLQLAERIIQDVEKELVS